MIHVSPLLKKTSFRQVVLDKWFPLIDALTRCTANPSVLAPLRCPTRCFGGVPLSRGDSAHVKKTATWVKATNYSKPSGCKGDAERKGERERERDRDRDRDGLIYSDS